MDSMDPKITRRYGAEIILGHVSRETGAGGFLYSAGRTFRCTARLLRTIPIKRRGVVSLRRFLKFNMASALLLSVFAQIAWAASDGQVMSIEQGEKKDFEVHAVITDTAASTKEIHQSEGSSTLPVVSESKVIKKKASANPLIKISTQGNLISLDARDVDLREVLNALSRASGIPITPIDIGKTSPITITTSFKDLPIESAINIVMRELPAGGIILVGADEDGKSKKSIKHVYVLTKAGSSVPPHNVDEEFYKQYLLFDSLLANARYEDALEIYDRLVDYGVEGARWLLTVIQKSKPTSDKTLKAACALFKSVGDPGIASSALRHILRSDDAGDWVKTKCIDELARWSYEGIEGDLRTISFDQEREINLRIVALREYKGRRGEEVIAELIPLLKHGDEQPIYTHKVIQYLAKYDTNDIAMAIESYVLSNDLSINHTLTREYGLIILRQKIGDDVVPVLEKVLQNKGTPFEVKERAIEILRDDALQGGRQVLEQFVSNSKDQSLINRARDVLGEDHQQINSYTVDGRVIDGPRVITE